MLAVEHVPHSGKSHLRQNHRSHAVARAHAGEVEGLFDVSSVAHPAPDARNLLCRIGQRVTHALLIEAGQRGCGGRGTHGRARTFGAAMAAAYEVRTKRQEKAATEV